jgi:hypothetical protein
MKRMSNRSLTIVTATLGLALFATACADEAPAATEALATTEAPAAEAGVPETLRHKDRAASVMDQPLDGSSVETFTEGLERIDQEGGEQEYRSVMSALDFLLFYDIGARRDKATLYKRLDGRTPTQILEQVKTHRAKTTGKKK